MKKILATLAITALSAAAFAGVTFDGRYDYASDTLNTTSSSNSTGTGGFAWNTAKMTFSGKASDSVTLKARFNFISSGNLHVSGKDLGTGINNTGATAGAASSDLVEYAQVSHKISDSLTAMCGKLENAGVSGFEGQERGQDMYFTSAGYLTSATRVTGVAFNYEFSTGRNLILEIFNGTNTYAADKTRTGAGLVYVGTYGDVGAIASYHTDPQGTNAALADKNNTYVTVGFSYKMNAYKFTFDYDMDTYGKGATSNNDKTSNSMVLTAKYDMGNGWTPGLKIESTSKVGFTGTASSDYTDAYTNMSLAGDYKAADGFFYHVAYVSKSTAYDSKNAYANATVAETLAYAGITYTADFMK